MTNRVRLITVCDQCFRASCWHGEFMCSRARSAGIIKKTEAELAEIGAEHADYYSRKNVERVCGATEYAEPQP